MKSITFAMPTTASFLSPLTSATWNPRMSLRHWGCSIRHRQKARSTSTTLPTFYRIELTMGESLTMAPWRKRLFIATSYLTADAADFFCLPRDRTVIVGA